MKKIAFFVEGQTEQIFICKLVKEIVTQKATAIRLIKFGGCNKPTIDVFPDKHLRPTNPLYYVLIYDCGGDDSVKSRIMEEHQNLATAGYCELVGVRDLFPKFKLSELGELEKRLACKLPSNATMIVAVHEIEAWFLSECNHFHCIDAMLTEPFIISNESSLGFNPYTDDMTLRTHPSQDLKSIYQLVGKTYNKDEDIVKRTVKCLDYVNIYMTLKNKITQLNKLILKIDTFLT